MPIVTKCSCGRTMQVKDEFAGRRVRCPSCRAVVEVPNEARESEPEPPTSIECHCSCGRTLRVKPEFAGKRVRCPDCRLPVSVPDTTTPEPPAELEDADIVEDLVPVQQSVTAKPRNRSAVDDDPPPLKRKRKRRRYDPDYDDRSPRRSSGGGFGSINAGTAGGCLMMVLAAVWFVVGIYAGWIFFYPPILFVFGLIAFFRGLMGMEDD